MRLHRAIVLVGMMVAAVVMVLLLTATGIATFDAHSFIALGVVLIAAAISGIAFSWNRYFKRR